MTLILEVGILKLRFFYHIGLKIAQKNANIKDIFFLYWHFKWITIAENDLKSNTLNPN